MPDGPTGATAVPVAAQAEPWRTLAGVRGRVATGPTSVAATLGEPDA